MNAVLAFATAVIDGIPKVIDLIKSGRSLKDIKIGEFVSTDAIEKLEGAKAKADDFIKNG
jgi:hypothetical protein